MSIIKNELLKQKKTLFILCILFPLLSNALLYVDLTYRYEAYLLIHQSEYGLSNWQLIFKEQTVFYFSEICVTEAPNSEKTLRFRAGNRREMNRTEESSRMQRRRRFLLPEIRRRRGRRPQMCRDRRRPPAFRRAQKHPISSVCLLRQDTLHRRAR